MIQATRQNQGSTYRIRLRSACSVANKRLSLEFDARCKGCPGEVAQGSLRFGKDMKKHRDIYMGLFSDFVLVEHAPFGESMGNSYEFFLGSPWSNFGIRQISAVFHREGAATMLPRLLQLHAWLPVAEIPFGQTVEDLGLPLDA